MRECKNLRIAVLVNEVGVNTKMNDEHCKYFAKRAVINNL